MSVRNCSQYRLKSTLNTGEARFCLIRALGELIDQEAERVLLVDHRIETHLSEIERDKKIISDLSLFTDEKFKGDAINFDIPGLKEVEQFRGVESINYVNEIKDQFVNQNKKNINSHLKSFFDKNDEEQLTIFMQNVNLSKAKFDFSVFSSEKLAKQEEIVDKSIFTLNNLNYKGIDLNQLTADKYRKIVLEREKAERNSRNELMKIAQNIYSLRHQREAKLTENFYFYEKNREENDYFLRKKYELEAKRNHFMKMAAEANKETYSEENAEKTKKMNRFKERYTQLEKQLSFTEKVMMEKRSSALSSQRDNLNIINDLDVASKRLKDKFTLLSQEQIEYYLSLLKAGIDVRSEGIAWIVKRLVELRAKLKAVDFPRFLDKGQIDYIVDIATSEVKVAQLKIELTSIKNKQKLKRIKQAAKAGKILTSTSQMNSTLTPKLKPKQMVNDPLNIMINVLETQMNTRDETIEQTKQEDKKLEELMRRVRLLYNNEEVFE